MPPWRWAELPVRCSVGGSRLVNLGQSSQDDIASAGEPDHACDHTSRR
jgi:hypothetical protein